MTVQILSSEQSRPVTGDMVSSKPLVAALKSNDLADSMPSRLRKQRHEQWI